MASGSGNGASGPGLFREQETFHLSMEKMEGRVMRG